LVADTERIPKDILQAIERTPGALDAFSMLNESDAAELVAYIEAVAHDPDHRERRIDMLAKALRR
jgi:uncharacterized protein YdeI (YjbR/CyaY-like superfamily)